MNPATKAFGLGQIQAREYLKNAGDLDINFDEVVRSDATLEDLEQTNAFQIFLQEVGEAPKLEVAK